MAFSREIIKKILQYVQFRVPQSEEKNSYYTVIGSTLVRVSNHSTRLYVWDDMLEKNSKWKGLPIVSIVFEDIKDTFDEDECLTLKRFRRKPIKIKEYVYNLQGNPQFLTPQDEKLIIQSIRKIEKGEYTDTTSKCNPPKLLVSVNPTQNNNPQEINCNTNMKRNKIRLTESDLHRIVKESVNNVIKEAYNPYDDETEQTAEGDFCEYAERYGLSALGYAIYDMIKKGDMEVNFDMANALWMYGGNVKEL